MRFERLLNRITVTAATLVAAVGGLGLTGWWWSGATAGGARPAGMVGRPDVAACLVLGGAALFCLRRKTPRWSAVGGWIFAGLMLLIALPGFIEAATGLHLRANEWLFRILSLRGPGYPGAMALSTSLGLVLAGGGLLDLRRGRWRAFNAPGWLGLTVCILGLLTLTEHLLLFLTRSGSEGASAMTTGAALGLVALGAGMAGAGVNPTFFNLFSKDNPTSGLARGLLGVALLMPVGLHATLSMWIAAQGPTRADELTLITTAVSIVVLVVLVLSLRRVHLAIRQHETVEMERDRLLARVQQQAATLQEQVAVRTQELREAGEANARLALAVAHATNLVIIADAQQRVTWVNTAFEHATGWTVAEMMGQSPSLFLTAPRTDPAERTRLQEILDAGRNGTVELAFHHKDGRLVHLVLYLHPLRDASDQLTSIVALGTDVTVYRETETRLRTALEQSDRFACLASRTVNGVIILNTEGRIEWVNPAWERFTGYTLAEAQGRSPESFLHGPRTDPRSVAEFKRAWLENQLTRTELVNYTRSGQPLVLDTETQPIPDENGCISCYFCVQTDITARRRAEEEMRSLNERLQLALQSADFGVWELDLASRRLTWDKRMLALHGCAAADFDGTMESWQRLIHPADRDQVEQIHARAQPGHTSLSIAFRIVRPDNAVRCLEGYASIHQDSDGRPRRLIGLARDITAEQELREQLRITEERWRLALIGNNDVVWDWRIDDDRLHFEPRCSEVTGYTSIEMPHSRLDWVRLIHPDDYGRNRTALEAHLTGRVAFYYSQYRIRHKEGRWVWILSRGKIVERDVNGQPVRMVGTDTDITDQTEAGERLRHNEELSLQMSLLAKIGAWEWTSASGKIMWSPEMYRIFEVELGFEPTLETLTVLLGAGSRTSLEEEIARAARNGQPFDLEVAFTTARKHRRWARVMGRTECTQGRITRIYGACQDVTDQREADSSRRRLETQLFQAQKMETLGTLAGGIAHDFNNLLTGILGYQDLAYDTVEEDHPVRLYLREAREASMRARKLVDQILTFGRQPEGEKVAVDLGQVIEEARRFLRSTVPSTINIETSIAPDSARVLADPTQLHQVLLNLGSNAAHAMRTRGGIMRIELASIRLDRAQAEALGNVAPGPYVRLSMSDTGQGMDEETLKRIFDPFFTTKGVGEGTGLGLSVVHGIVRAHRGVIDVRSAPGKGATFTIYLPAAMSDEDAITSETTPVPVGAGEVICVVDDEEYVLNLTKQALEKTGYHAVTFDSPTRCLEALRSEHSECAVLLTDQTMPGMKGVELAAQVRGFATELPIIIMSGYFSKMSSEKLSNLGRISLLAKPFTRDDLGRAVHRALHPEE